MPFYVSGLLFICSYAILHLKNKAFERFEFMKDTIVRIESIEIRNFKNVGYGHIDFENSKKGYKASILGLYGQNGSGKTALIDALSLLKFALSGRSIPHYFADYVNVDSEYALFCYTVKIYNEEQNISYRIVYEFKLKGSVDNVDYNYENVSNGKSKAVIFDEVLSYAYDDGNKKIRLSNAINARGEGNTAFLPMAKYHKIIGKDASDHLNLMVTKRLCLATSRSFVFSKEMRDITQKNCQDEHHIFIINRLVYFANSELFVVDTASSSRISLNTLPVFIGNDDERAYENNVLININDVSLIPENKMEGINKLISCMNVVLAKLIPNLEISFKNMGMFLFPNGNNGYRIQLMSNKNNKQIPLKYESDGIKKIISVLHLLIAMYNKPSISVAIDELDAGVFEYLLGEILRIISEKGKGQLVFTSHNLRPLETLDKCFIAFTTTNANNRYIRMSNIKKTNNLRDFYYRDIILGEQSEIIYELTNNSEIAMAFREAGIINE